MYSGGKDLKNKGIIALLAGFMINMSFGVLYSWSIFSLNLTEVLNWSKTSASLPYMTAIFVFAIVMTPAGKLQDRFGGRKIAAIGGILTGIGFILSSVFTSVFGICMSFGVLAGSGIGIGYASVTPSVMKWFPDEKKGLITGVVISGFGLSTIYMAPLTNWMINSFGLFASFRILGLAFIIIVTVLSQFLFDKGNNENKESAVVHASSVDVKWNDMIKTKEFIMMWVMLASGSLGGLMIIGHLSKIAAIQLGSNVGFILVAFTAIANATGRPLSGILSDKIGRTKTMIILALTQGIIFLFFGKLNSFAALMFGASVVTFTYGGNFSVYPSAISDRYGKKNFGLNYGMLFTSWGIGGVTGPLLGGKVVDIFGSYSAAYIIAASLSIFATAIGLVLYKMEKKDTKELARETV
jgi:OFA family oxalate/formate antiporter-like MFS transporter